MLEDIAGVYCGGPIRQVWRGARGVRCGGLISLAAVGHHILVALANGLRQTTHTAVHNHIILSDWAPSRRIN